jgi:hypothetical protein
VGHGPLSTLSRPELEALLVDLLGEVAGLKQTIGDLRGEIARLKGLKGRPDIKPSGMEQGTDRAKRGKAGKRRGRGKVRWIGFRGHRFGLYKWIVRQFS